MNYFKQVYSDMREQPLATWLSIGGTALSLFMVMAVFTLGEIDNVPNPPESCRKSLMIGENIHIQFNSPDNQSGGSSGLSGGFALRLYGNLEGVEKMSLFTKMTSHADVNIAGGLPETMENRETDSEYWNIFDFEFIKGRPYTKEEVEANVPVAVVTESTARKLFGSVDAVGKDINIRQRPYRVTGVVKDVHPLMRYTYSDIYTRVGRDKESGTWISDMEKYTGDRSVALLLAPGTSYESVRRQVENRYEALNAGIGKRESMEFFYHGQPYDVATDAVNHGSNTTPDATIGRRIRWIAYTVLLLLPAINLSGMTRSRMRRRVREIGVRRAFGCTRLGVVRQMLCENLIVTLIGGLAGFILSAIFVVCFSNLFFDMTSSWSPSAEMIAATPTFSMLFTWQGFGFALLFCLVLNIVSAGFPVWKAASVNPAEAISDNDNYQK